MPNIYTVHILHSHNGLIHELPDWASSISWTGEWVDLEQRLFCKLPFLKSRINYQAKTDFVRFNMIWSLFLSVAVIDLTILSNEPKTDAAKQIQMDYLKVWHVNKKRRLQMAPSEKQPQAYWKCHFVEFNAQKVRFNFCELQFVYFDRLLQYPSLITLSVAIWASTGFF